MMESEREKHIKWSWHPYHMVCIVCLWSGLQLSLFFKVLPSPTPGANKRKAEDSKGKGSAKKPSAGAAKKGVFKRWNIHLTELEKKTFPSFPFAVFLIDEMTPEIPVTVFCSFTNAAVLTVIHTELSTFQKFLTGRWRNIVRMLLSLHHHLCQEKPVEGPRSIRPGLPKRSRSTVTLQIEHGDCAPHVTSERDGRRDSSFGLAFNCPR